MEKEHKTDGTPCWCNPRVINVPKCYAFEVFHQGEFISCDSDFMSIFRKRFKYLIDTSGDWIYFVGRQDDDKEELTGMPFLYRLHK